MAVLRCLAVVLLVLSATEAFRGHGGRFGGRGGRFGGHGGRGPNGFWEPMLANLSTTARQEFFEIARNMTLTKQDRSAALASWANTQGLTDKFNERKTSCEGFKTNITAAYATFSANLSAEAKSLANSVMQLINNQTITQQQEWQQAQNLLQGANSTIRMELFTFLKQVHGQKTPGMSAGFPVRSCCAVIGFCGLPGPRGGRPGRGPGGRGGFPGGMGGSSGRGLGGPGRRGMGGPGRGRQPVGPFVMGNFGMNDYDGGRRGRRF